MKDLYRDKTNKDVYADNSDGSYSDEYVKWLESELETLRKEKGIRWVKEDDGNCVYDSNRRKIKMNGLFSGMMDTLGHDKRKLVIKLLSETNEKPEQRIIEGL